MPSLLTRLKPLYLRVGSTRVTVLTAKKRQIFDEPARVAVSNASGSVLGFGQAAVDLAALGASDIRVLSLFENGIPVDPELCREYFLWMRESFTTTKLRHVLPYAVYTVIPINFPRPYAQLYHQSLRSAHFFPLGSELAVKGDAWMELGSKAMTAQLIIIRIGATETQIAQLGQDTIVAASVLHQGGNDLDHALVRHLRRQYSLSLPMSSCSALKENYTKAQFGRTPFSMTVRGKHIRTSEVVSVNLSAQDLTSVFSSFFTELSALIATKLSTDFHFMPGQSTSELYLSGGLSLFAESRQSLESVLGTSVKTVSRPTVASVVGIAARYS